MVQHEGRMFTDTHTLIRKGQSWPFEWYILNFSQKIHIYWYGETPSPFYNCDPKKQPPTLPKNPKNNVFVLNHLEDCILKKLKGSLRSCRHSRTSETTLMVNDSSHWHPQRCEVQTRRFSWGLDLFSGCIEVSPRPITEYGSDGDADGWDESPAKRN